MSILKAEKDFEEFIELLNKNNIEYMIVGAYALALYAKPRNTGDLDIFINNSKKNAAGLIKVLEEFGIKGTEISEKDFLTEKRIVQLGVSPVRIDLINSIDGVEFGDAYPHIERVRFGSSTANFISCDDLIKNKSSSNRKKDQADLEELLGIED